MTNCQSCGAPLAPVSESCIVCGAPAGPAPPPETETARRLRLFVGANYPVYEARWCRMDERGSAISWHWPAFMLPVAWLGYRNMRGIALAFIGIDAVEFCIECFYDASAWISGLIALAFALFVALNANRWYRAHAELEIAAAVANAAPENLDADIVRRGATSVWAGVGFVVLWFLALFVAAFIPELVGPLRG